MRCMWHMLGIVERARVPEPHFNRSRSQMVSLGLMAAAVSAEHRSNVADVGGQHRTGGCECFHPIGTNRLPHSHQRFRQQPAGVNGAR